MGSAPNIAAVATPNPHHPSSQGMVQIIGVWFIDHHSNLYCNRLDDSTFPGALGNRFKTGKRLDSNRIEQHTSAAQGQKYFCALLFFSSRSHSIISNYSYAENALTYLKWANKPGIFNSAYFWHSQ